MENIANVRKLWSAVLDRAYNDAIANALMTHANREKIISDARRWFNSNRKDICSFLWICEILDLESSNIRKNINKTIPSYYGDDLQSVHYK